MFGNHPVPLQGAESRNPPPAFASEPLIHASAAGDTEYNNQNCPMVGKDGASTTRPNNLDILKIDELSTGTSPLRNHEPNFLKSTSPTGVRYLTS